MAQGIIDPEFLGSSARKIALGDLESVDSKGYEYIFQNPATIQKMPAYSFGYLSTKILEEINYNSIAFGVGNLYDFYWGIGIYRAWVDGIHYTDYVNNEVISISQYTYNHSKMKLVAGQQLDKDSAYGVAVEMHNISAGSYASGSGLSFDLGYTKRIDSMELGIKLDNIFSMYNWGTGTAEPIRLRYSAGVKYAYNDKTNIYFELKHEDGMPFYYNFAVDYEFIKGFELRGALYQIIDGTGMNFGLGYANQNLRIDYAYRNNFSLPDSAAHVLSLSLQFGDAHIHDITPDKIARWKKARPGLNVKSIKVVEIDSKKMVELKMEAIHTEAIMIDGEKVILLPDVWIGKWNTITRRIPYTDKIIVNYQNETFLEKKEVNVK